MAHSLCADSSHLALELHAFLRSVDPARWREDLEARARARLKTIRSRLREILEQHDAPTGDRRLTGLYERLQVLARHIEKHRPRARRSVAAKDQWQDFQLQLQPLYAGLASSLNRLAMPVPALRPTNYGRNVFHFGCGVLALVLVHYVLPPAQMWMAPVGFALFCWTVEGLRVRFEVVTRIFMWFLGPIAHPHEHHRVNSATWFGTALAILAVFFSPNVASVGVAVLCVADPVAALVGRRFGSTRLRGGRTLEGSFGFVIAGVVASIVVLRIWYPELGWGVAAVVAMAASLCGAVVELVSGRIDDNLTIPVAAAGAGALVMMGLGL